MQDANYCSVLRQSGACTGWNAGRKTLEPRVSLPQRCGGSGSRKYENRFSPRGTSKKLKEKASGPSKKQGTTRGGGEEGDRAGEERQDDAIALMAQPQENIGTADRAEREGVKQLKARASCGGG